MIISMTRPNQPASPLSERAVPANSLPSLDPGTVSDAIPSFFVGRNRDGLWVVRDTKGETGGIFLFKASATSFVRRHRGPVGCATIFLTEQFELDVANSGNPLAESIGWCLRHVRGWWQSVTARTADQHRR